MFLALDITESDKAKLAQWRNQQLTLPFKAVNPDNFHITLAFLGLINSAQQTRLTQAINQQIELYNSGCCHSFSIKKHFSITLAKVDYF